MSVHPTDEHVDSETPLDDAVPPQPDDGRLLGRIGALETRLARSASEIDAAQAIRYRVFAQEMGARMSPANERAKRDADGFDAVCDHLLVLDTEIPGSSENQIVGTYRLLPGSVAAQNGGFYSASEFAVDPLLARHPDKRFMELGRSCVLPGYRTRRTTELLWQGNWAYSLRHGIDVMFGCASLSGTDPASNALALSFLHHFCAASPEWQVSGWPGQSLSMDRLAKDDIDSRRALAGLPPLIKGYLRLGAMVGDGAFVDHDFGTTDVMIILPIEKISPRYVSYYGQAADRFV